MGEEDLLFHYVIFTSHSNKQIWSWFRKSSQELGCLTGQPLHHCHEAWRNVSWCKGMKKKNQNLNLIILSPLGPLLLRREQIWACFVDPAARLSLCWQLGWDLLCPQDLLSYCLGRETCLSNPALWGRSGIWCLSFRSAALLFHTATPPDPSFMEKTEGRWEGPSSALDSHSKGTLFAVFLPPLNPEDVPNAFYSIRIFSYPFFHLLIHPFNASHDYKCLPYGPVSWYFSLAWVLGQWWAERTIIKSLSRLKGNQIITLFILYIIFIYYISHILNIASWTPGKIFTLGFCSNCAEVMPVGQKFPL